MISLVFHQLGHAQGAVIPLLRTTTFQVPSFFSPFHSPRTLSHKTLFHLRVQIELHSRRGGHSPRYSAKCASQYQHQYSAIWPASTPTPTRAATPARTASTRATISSQYSISGAPSLSKGQIYFFLFSELFLSLLFIRPTRWIPSCSLLLFLKCKQL